MKMNCMNGLLRVVVIGLGCGGYLSAKVLILRVRFGWASVIVRASFSEALITLCSPFSATLARFASTRNRKGKTKKNLGEIDGFECHF